MLRFRALFLTLACVVAAVLGTAGATRSEPPSHTVRQVEAAALDPANSAAAPAIPDPTPGERVSGSAPTARHAHFEATAVRHVATPTQPASDDSMDPMIDKSMVLLIGWAMLMLLGGSAIAAHRPAHR